ncbi:hypothetical protein L1049_003743 [Liquidambar formosana]|uniref:Uncharacterized protein n=1 Tax=Liquidambar formosana TaxID=63359 RepID=A0AAP0WZZ5_LIQFO
MFSESYPPLPWDKENNYTRDAIEVYYEANSGVCLPKTKILRHLLEGTAGSHLESIGDEEKVAIEHSNHGISAVRMSSILSSVPVSSEGPSKWVKVNEKRTLHDVLKEPNFVIPGIPVFYVVSKRSSFYKEFRSGKWVPPS